MDSIIEVACAERGTEKSINPLIGTIERDVYVKAPLSIGSKGVSGSEVGLEDGSDVGS